VVTEIESLKQIRHRNVIKLYAYNLNAKYPANDSSKIDSILLVLEYAPAGELFDILYYTSALDPVLARTYFRQSIAGLEACHNAGIAHRDIKPQNLLLDSRFNLKITDFGLSKVFESDADAIMKTTYVGTRGYQAPELLLDKPYDLQCDVFSMGVVLFILITGYPPFEQAHNSDRWFKPLGKGDYARFWKYHNGCAISNDSECKDLLQKMMCYDPAKRITIAGIKKHPWFNGQFKEGKELIRSLRYRHRDMEQKRRKDARKINDLQQSITMHRNTKDPYVVPELYPMKYEDVLNHCYTTLSPKTFFPALTAVVDREYKGLCEVTPENNTCKVSIRLSNNVSLMDIKFEVQLFRSSRFQATVADQATDSKDNTEDTAMVDADDQAQKDDELAHSNNRQDCVYVVKFRHLQGDELKYRRNVVDKLVQFDQVFTGLPAWVKKNQKNNELDAANDSDSDDDEVYENVDPEWE
jgi:serine/threonine protein kinase